MILNFMGTTIPLSAKTGPTALPSIALVDQLPAILEHLVDNFDSFFVVPRHQIILLHHVAHPSLVQILH